MASNFKYAGKSDLTKYFNRVSDYDSKTPIYNWVSFGSNIYVSYDTGVVTQLFANGEKLNVTSQSDVGNWSTTLTATLDGTPDSDGTTYNILNYNASFLTGSEGDMKAGTYILIGSEMMFVESVNTATNQLTVKRGSSSTSPPYEATTIAQHSASDPMAEKRDFNEANEWHYDSSLNQVVMYSATDPNDLIIEAGVDYETFVNQSLVDASLELHNYLDARYSTPIEKIKQVDSDTAALSVAEEYDPIIIKSVCYIATANLIRAKEGTSEEADYFHSLVTNADRTGLIDKLNDGIYKLSFEVDANDKKGSIRHRSVAGTMDLVELSGEYHGESYDLLKVEIETSGVYGTSEYKVHYLSDDKLFGAVTSAEKITGGLQHIYGGLYGRFQGSSATDGDIWEIEVYGSHRKQTNKSSASIEMIR